ncbi:MAG: LLM class flavin-dependent oxidoreductase [Sphingopyxis sp.]|nr:LLM class flavin-dependent oxidoreductase [Sphingopyxis sp.]
MKFGIFYELQLPRPWKAGSEQQLFHDALDQLELADRLGYDHAWAVEHHFLEEYSHSSAPEVFLGAASQRTRNIRLGHGIIQLTTNHPARVAERVATLDLLSKGRVELGIGEGSTPTELEPFGVDLERKREIWEEAVRAIMPMFGEGRTAHQGVHFNLPLRNVLPKPWQKPHPPLWLACSQLEAIAYAGMRGMGALGFQFLNADTARTWVKAYYDSLLNRLDRVGNYAVNPNIALVSMFMCAPTDEEARQKAEGATFFQWCLRYYRTLLIDGADQDGTSNLWDLYMQWKADNLDAIAAMQSFGLIGSPETLRRKLRKFESSHIDQVILLNQAGHNTHEDICASLELFAREVMPEFHANIPRHEAWKAKVLARELPLDEIDEAPADALAARA